MPAHARGLAGGDDEISLRRAVLDLGRAGANRRLGSVTGAPLPRARAAVAAAAITAVLTDGADATATFVGNAVAVVIVTGSRAAIQGLRGHFALTRAPSLRRAGLLARLARAGVGAAAALGAVDAGAAVVWRAVAVVIVAGDITGIFGLWTNRAQARSPFQLSAAEALTNLAAAFGHRRQHAVDRGAIFERPAVLLITCVAFADGLRLSAGAITAGAADFLWRPANRLSRTTHDNGRRARLRHRAGARRSVDARRAARARASTRIAELVGVRAAGVGQEGKQQPTSDRDLQGFQTGLFRWRRADGANLTTRSPAGMRKLFSQPTSQGASPRTPTYLRPSRKSVSQNSAIPLAEMTSTAAETSAAR